MKSIVYKYDTYWKGLFNWMDDTVVARNFAQDRDLDLVHPANNSEDVLEMVKKELEEYKVEKTKAESVEI